MDATVARTPEETVGRDHVIPVLKPRLPSAASLAPYLARIDDTRIYSNFGPLVLNLEERLGRRLGLSADDLACAASGTAALVGAILALAGRASTRRPLALMPAYTFVATAVAAEQCGYQVSLSDIAPRTWALDPKGLLDHPELDRIGVIIPVAPYGKGVPQAGWRRFRETTGVPVIIDGAASFEAACSDPDQFLGDIPVAMSFHATKSFACGEGGAVACSDPAVIRDTGRALNFGFYGSRDSRSASINGKMSEYHAAVGLAELDGWESKQRALLTAGELYREACASEGLLDRLVIAPEICSSYVLFVCEDGDESERVQSELNRGSIGFRHWYGLGLHRQRHFAGVARPDSRVTDDLAPRVLGLPVAPDLSQNVIERVVAALAAGADPGR